MITIRKYNEAYIYIQCESDIAYELQDYFTFMVPGYKFMPAYKNKMWDGKIRLYNPMTKLLYAGLLQYVIKFCQSRDYKYELSDDFNANNYSLAEAKQFVESLNVPSHIELRDYQLEVLTHAVRDNRGLMLSPTASGKSFIIYTIIRYLNRKTLIVVPTTSLVHQMYSDFESYGFDSENNVHKIFSAQEKITDKQIVVTTWQSIYKLKKEWFSQFDVVIGDEAHLFKATSLTSIMTKLDMCKYRFGFTGTLDGTQTHKLVLEGLFGPVRKIISTAELIEKKYVSDLKIKALVLKYSDDIRKLSKNLTYQQEMDFIVQHKPRNKFIKNLALSLKGHTLILFQYVDKHGKILYDSIKDEKENVFFIHGSVDGTQRDAIRHQIKDLDSSLIIASYGTTSTGVNIPQIENIIFASPSKSRIRNLQSIGRGLRLSEDKSHATLYDIADDLSWKSKTNHTLKHFAERIKTYSEEDFEYKIYNINL